MFQELSNTIQKLDAENIASERKKVLQPLIEYIQSKLTTGSEIKLNFICTHNSRRSQLAQIWAKTAASNYGIEIKSYSGGVEVTAFNERAVEALKKAGFQITKEGDGNAYYSVSFDENNAHINAFSKTYDDPINPTSAFAAVMTCSHADENCPFIAGAEIRLPIRYDDPKEYDDTPLEASKYDERSLQIANEMFYVFSQVNK
ncbi:MAG TPA: protein-tyrosine-phosphatase [Fulvivirga sp.]|nr:protein-tyrosine-phosphatase [Fulvivirga sp.]